MKYIVAMTFVFIVSTLSACSTPTNHPNNNEPQQSSINSMTRIKQRPTHVKPMPPHAKYSELDTPDTAQYSALDTPETFS